MADLPESFYVHRAAVRRIVGHNAYEEVYEESLEFPCFISHRRRLVRGADGEEIVSSAVIRCPLALEGLVTPESEIVIHTERAIQGQGTVVAVDPNVDGGFGAWQHLRVEVG